MSQCGIRFLYPGGCEKTREFSCDLDLITRYLIVVD